MDTVSLFEALDHVALVRRNKKGCISTIYIPFTIGGLHSLSFLFWISR